MRRLFCALVLFAPSLAAQAEASLEPTAEQLAQVRQIVALCAGENDASAQTVIEACSSILDHETRERPWDHARTQRGSAFLEVEDYDAAIADFDVVLSRSPTAWDVLALRAVAYSGKGDIARARGDIAQAVVLNPGEYAVHYLAGFIHELNDDLDAAIASFSRVLALKPSMRDALFARGALYERKGLRDKALADYSAMVTLDPRDILARHSRGAVYAQLGKVEEARTDFMAAAHVESRSTKRERDSEPTASLDGQFYVRPCKLPNGTFAPAEWVPLDPTKPKTFDYSESHTDPETGFCIKSILAKHPNATRESAALKQPQNTRQSDARRGRGFGDWEVFDRGDVGRPSAPISAPAASDSESDGPSWRGTPAPYGSASEPLKPPRYIPYVPRAVTSDVPRRRVVSPDSMDTRYNPYETIEEARHGRGRRYDPYATRDSWAVDRSNPYAISPAYKYGIYNPFAGSATPYNPPTTFGGGPEINNWQTNRYNPFGTRRSSPVISGDGRAPLTPLHPRTNCPNKSSNPLNPYAPRSC